jgi:hypothetical protein
LTSIARPRGHQRQNNTPGSQETGPFQLVPQPIRSDIFHYDLLRWRGVNQLCKEDVAGVSFDTARRYHSKLIRDFKRIATRLAKIDWQRNFFDHRLRHDENETEKFAYIRQNPVRAGLIGPDEKWRYAIDANDLEAQSKA